MDERADPWSATRFDVHERLRALRASGDAILATIVDVEGSAYRRPGAKMVVADGESAGAITAGCLEGPVLDLAADVQATGTARVETFDLTDDEEWGLGLGCNGVIDVLLEPLDDSLDSALAELAAKRPVAVLTVVSAPTDEVPVGARVTATADDEMHASTERPGIPDWLLDTLRPAATAAREDGHATIELVSLEGGELSIFVDGIEPTYDLLLFGNQNDVQPVSRLARQVGFRVVVASGRGARSDADSFPYAHDVRSIRPPDLADVVDADAYTAAVLMSHNFVDDRLALDSLLSNTDVPYVGLMGPRKRFERMRDELAADGVTLNRADLARIATPIGLDLGGGEPVEIATSIVGEVLAVTNGRAGGRLRDHTGPIHPRFVDPQ